MSRTGAAADLQGVVFAVDQTAMHDGPGLRMTVYLKGCPLYCLWCHSPESISPRPEVVWYETRCTRCGACARVCPEGLRDPGAPPPPVDGSEACRRCLACVNACPARALEMKGYLVTAGEMAAQAARLIPFFRRTGGGITLTGGEPLLQAEFSCAVAGLCREQGIHVAVETSGCASWERLRCLAAVTDLFLYDLKHADPERHRALTGVSAGPIQENLRRLVAHGAAVVARVPVIPGCNDTPAEIQAVATLAYRCGVRRLSLLPFNPAAPGKYAWLRRSYPLAGARRQSAAEMAALEALARAAGLEVLPP